MKFICFDCETTGLIKKKSFQGQRPWFTGQRPVKFDDFYPPEDFEMYNSSRLLSAGWLVYNKLSETDNYFVLVDKQYHVVTPTFEIPDDSIKIHGITKEIAAKDGIDVSQVLDNFLESIKDCSHIVGHNLINFDLNILKSECFRLKRTDVIDALNKVRKLDTMVLCKPIVQAMNNWGRIKNPSLTECYTYLFQKRPTTLTHHHAAVDAQHTADVLIGLIQTGKISSDQM